MYKQVIVIRKDLMDPFEEFVGKMIVQGGHGVGLNILSLMNGGQNLIDNPPKIVNGEYELNLKVKVGSGLDDWFRGIYKKVCVCVKSEEQLINLYNKVKDAGLPVEMVEDIGLTKFNGQKTKTAICIGPADEVEIDKLTKRLRLL
jgi:peptidyl-tRNA hydrolase